MWFRIILLHFAFWFLYFLGSINVITKTNYNSQSYNSPNSIILVYSIGLQFRLFSFLCFSLLMIALSQPLTSFYFLWVLCSYSLWFFCYSLWFFCSYLLWFLCNLLWFYLIFFLPFYYLLISSSRLLPILVPKAAPTPSQKPNTRDITAPITLPSGPLRGLLTYLAVFSSPPFLLSPISLVPLVRSPFLLRSDK